MSSNDNTINYVFNNDYVFNNYRELCTILKELKERQHYTKPSVERREKKKLRLRRIKANNDSF